MDYNLLLKKAFRIFGLEIKRYNFLNAEEPLLKKIIRDFNIQNIIDVGANEGQYATQLLKNGYKGKIYSFEPIVKPFNILKNRAEKNSNWHVFHTAVGNVEENLSINVSENVVSSSIFEVSDYSLVAEPSTRIVRKENIKVTTIDNFFKERADIQGEILLKLDVQGFELKALEGSIKTLNKIKIIQVELSFTPAYNGAPLFVEVASFLENHGYEMFTLLPGFRDRNSGRLLQADGLFVRKN